MTKPVHTVRLGRVQAHVFENVGTDGPWFSTVVHRLYKEGAATKSAQSFGRDDLLVAAEVLRQCYLWVAAQGKENA